MSYWILISVIGNLGTSCRVKVPAASLADRTRMVLHFHQDNALPKEGIHKNLRWFTMKIANQVVSKVNHFCKTTNTKKVKHHFQKSFLNMVKEAGDILAGISVTLMVIMVFSLIMDTGRTVVALN
jgi:hypothetical protein